MARLTSRVSGQCPSRITCPPARSHSTGASRGAASVHCCTETQAHKVPANWLETGLNRQVGPCRTDPPPGTMPGCTACLLTSTGLLCPRPLRAGCILAARGMLVGIAMMCSLTQQNPDKFRLRPVWSSPWSARFGQCHKRPLPVFLPSPFARGFRAGGYPT